MTAYLARVCALHPWRTVGGWLAAIVVAVALVATLLGPNLTSDAEVTNDAESLRADDLIVENMPPPEFFAHELVVVRSENLRVDDPAFRTKLEELVAAGRATGVVTDVRGEDGSLASDDGRAPLLPLLLAIVSILVALGLTALVASGWELSLFVVNMLSGMGLALGIDYALFVVSRFREERRAGREKLDAIAATGGSASRAVLFSGSAFVLAMVGLLLVQSTIMRSLAVGAILVGIVSVVAALTLLPAILSLLGDKVDRMHV